MIKHNSVLSAGLHNINFNILFAPGAELGLNMQRWRIGHFALRLSAFAGTFIVDQLYQLQSHIFISRS